MDMINEWLYRKQSVRWHYIKRIIGKYQVQTLCGFKCHKNTLTADGPYDKNLVCKKCEQICTDQGLWEK